MFSNNFVAIIAFVAAHKLATILILFGAMIIEGESFLIIAGVLVHLEALSIWEVLGVAILGALIGDFLWYFLGVYFRKVERAKPVIHAFEKIVGRLLPRFKEKPFLSLVLAKYIYGTNHATLILSGVIDVDIWLFTKAEIVATSLWVVIFVALGYLFGSAALLVSHRVSIFFLVVLVLIVTFMAIQRAVVFYYESQNVLKK
mgnify:CR=1 FL=1